MDEPNLTPDQAVRLAVATVIAGAMIINCGFIAGPGRTPEDRASNATELADALIKAAKS